MELGVRFRADVAGQVTGLRFYKGPQNTGTHVGSLWTAGGQLLGRVTFAAETATGWQQASFAAPVPVAANTVYVASYHAPQGRYSQDAGYFAAAGVDRPPLRAPRDGESGGTGSTPTARPRSSRRRPSRPPTTGWTSSLLPAAGAAPGDGDPHPHSHPHRHPHAGGARG